MKNIVWSARKKWHQFLQKQPPEAFCEKGVLRNFEKFIGKSNTGVSYEFCEIFQNTFYTEHLWATASVYNFHGILPWLKEINNFLFIFLYGNIF